MPFLRRVLHCSPGPADLRAVLSERAIEGCWFELHRQGGCGAGKLTLRDEFARRGRIEIGDWVALEYAAGQRWYLGRVRERRATWPAGVALRLEGMASELREEFPGGFGSHIADGVPPHRYARADLFPSDPDRADEAIDAVGTPHALVSRLLEQYVVGTTHILHDPDRIRAADPPGEITSLKFRGEEPVASVLQDLALRAGNASWGVDETGTFYFLPPPEGVLATYRAGRELLVLEERRDLGRLYNRVLLTGGLVYDAPETSGALTRGYYRWRGNYIEPNSRAAFGQRQFRVSVPWIRTRDDARQFVAGFFREYALPRARYVIEVAGGEVLPRPWSGRVRIEDQGGSEIVTAPLETVRVAFDRVPRFRLEIGPLHPRVFWPEPPPGERTTLPSEPQPERGGGDLIVIDDAGSGRCAGALVCDTFTAADGTGLGAHTMDVGAGWTELNGRWEIQSGRAASLGAPPGVPHWVALAEAGAADVEVRVVVRPAGDSNCGIVVRASDADNFWSVELLVLSPGTAELRLYERNSGTWVLRAVAFDVAAAPDRDSTLTVTAVGTTITGRAGDREVTYDAAAHNRTATQHGLRADKLDCRFDDFRVIGA